MMRRVGDIWSDIVSMDNLIESAKLACKRRKNKREVARFKENQTVLLEKLQTMLMDHTFVSSQYKIFQVRENGKVRDVANLPLYPDRIVHWAISRVVEPIINSRLIDQTHASRVKHGTHSAMTDAYKYLRRDSRIKYCLKTDVRKFFPSVDRIVIKSKLRTIIKDKDALALMDRIIDDYPLTGIAIGNRVSPMMANLCLSEMDHVMKEVHHVHYYVRYMDDVVILGYSKPWLHQMRKIMSAILGEMGLTMEGKWQIFPVDTGIDFVGWRIYSTHILIRKRTKVKIKAASDRLAEKVASGRELNKHDHGTIASYNGLMKWCNAYNLYRSTFWPVERANRELIAERKSRSAYCRYFEMTNEFCNGTVTA